MSSSSGRFERQASLVPSESLAALAVTVIGIGAIGRQVTLQLAALGVQRLQLIDFDVVEETNITTQGYLRRDLGVSKVEATGRAVSQIDPCIELALVTDRYRPAIDTGDSVLCCVDSITARGAIWRRVGHRSQFWSDGRMLGEVMRILTAADDAGRRHYPTTLFQQADAQSGACTARGTIYTAAIAAGLMVQQFSRWLRKLPLDADLSVNLLASEMAAT